RSNFSIWRLIRKWSSSEGLELDASMNGEVLSVLNVKEAWDEQKRASGLLLVLQCGYIVVVHLNEYFKDQGMERNVRGVNQWEHPDPMHTFAADRPLPKDQPQAMCYYLSDMLRVLPELYLGLVPILNSLFISTKNSISSASSSLVYFLFYQTNISTAKKVTVIANPPAIINHTLLFSPLLAPGIGIGRTSVCSSPSISELSKLHDLKLSFCGPRRLIYIYFPSDPTDMTALMKGLHLLNHADPFIEISIFARGEHVLAVAGEVHLERCIKDLKDRFAKVDLVVSPPLVSFRETIEVETVIGSFFCIRLHIGNQIKSNLVEK
ncbi:elongation factor-like GTPase 1, partial [Tanacetum coccineum]